MTSSWDVAQEEREEIYEEKREKREKRNARELLTAWDHATSCFYYQYDSDNDEHWVKRLSANHQLRQIARRLGFHIVVPQVVARGGSQ